MSPIKTTELTSREPYRRSQFLHWWIGGQEVIRKKFKRINEIEEKINNQNTKLTLKKNYTRS